MKIRTSYRETKDGKFYLYGYYCDGNSKQLYDIGMKTPNGDEVIDTVSGFRAARQRLKEIIKKDSAGIGLAD